MPRMHLFEFVDEPWYPNFMRQSSMDFLFALYRILRIYEPAYKKIAEVLEKTNTNTIIDCCSGGGGPTQVLREYFDANNKKSVVIMLTDKYPDLNLYEKIESRYPEKIVTYKKSLDVMSLPNSLKGMRTFFTAFHHFQPERALKILQDAVNNEAPIGIFECTERRPIDFIRMVLSPLFFPIVVPFAKRLDWKKILFTYIIPVTPFTNLWEFFASCMRTYSPVELQKIIKQVDAPNYHWEVGRLWSKRAMCNVTYLIGYKTTVDEYMLIWLFPGQGSQFIGMGENLFDEFPEMTAQADEIVGYSLKELCLQDTKQQLNQTQYTQPALYVVNALTYFKKLKESQQKPDAAAGHSLGEYNALLAAEVFDFSTGLQLVKKRGELMSNVVGGSMAAVMGLSSDEVKNILEQHQLTHITIGNYNSYTQSVLSSAKEDIDRAQSIFKKLAGVTFIPLKTSGAFHSHYMSSIQQQFIEFISQIKFDVPMLPVFANINALPYHPAVIASNLADQIVAPVQWLTTIEYCLQEKNVIFEEVGVGNILMGLVKRIQKGQ